MNRRAAAGAVVLAVLAVVSTSGCGAVADPDVAAAVGDGDVSRSDLESLLQAQAANADITQVVEDPLTGTVDAAAAQGSLTRMVIIESNDQFLAANGEAITDADRETALEVLGQQTPELLDLPENVQTHYVALEAGSTARDRVGAPDAAEQQRRYEESPASLGVLCLRDVVTADRAAAEEVVEAMAEGTPLSELASDHSTDEVTAANGGALELQAGQPCPSALEVLQTLGPDFFAAAIDLRPDEATQPVQLEDGWHVIEARPYDEVADAVAAQLEASGGLGLFVGHLLGTDVRVDPRYGRWDRTQLAVVAL